MFLVLVLACATTATAPVATQTPEPNQDRAPAISPAPATLSAAAVAVAAPDRSAKDRAMDAQRQPVEMLELFRIEPGQTVLELGAGGGYTTELIARTVGPTGQVYGQNSPWMLEHFAEGPWSERLSKPVMSQVSRIDAEFDAPLPAELHGQLDAVLIVLFYHDTVWMEVDRAAMNQEIFDALKPGGLYGIVDHSAKLSDGVAVTKSLHRISEQVVVDEVTAAGFRLSNQGYFLRNPQDTMDLSASPGTAAERRGTSDRFVHMYRKPFE